jgi:hypothetical protein
MSDSVSTVKIPVLTRDGNYRHWARQIRSMLILADGLDEFLDAEPADSAQARRKDKITKARIQLHVGGALRDVVDRAETAKAAWDALRAEYMGALHLRQP